MSKKNKQINNSPLTIDDIADFTWGFNHRFLLETRCGNFVWSDPEYGGDNTIRPYKGDPRNFTDKGFCGRDKGKHVIKDYCGPDVKIFYDAEADTEEGIDRAHSYKDVHTEHCCMVCGCKYGEEQGICTVFNQRVKQSHKCGELEVCGAF